MFNKKLIKGFYEKFITNFEIKDISRPYIEQTINDLANLLASTENGSYTIYQSDADGYLAKWLKKFHIHSIVFKRVVQSIFSKEIELLIQQVYVNKKISNKKNYDSFCIIYKDQQVRKTDSKEHVDKSYAERLEICMIEKGLLRLLGKGRARHALKILHGYYYRALESAQFKEFYYRYLAKIYSKMKDYRKVQQVCSILINDNCLDSEIYKIAIRSCTITKRYSIALTLCEKAINNNIDQEHYLLEKALFMGKLGDIDAAIELCDRFIHKYGFTIRAYIYKATCLMMKDDYLGARALCLEALGKDINNNGIYTILITSCLESGNITDANKYYYAAKEINGLDKHLIISRAEYYLTINNPQFAKEYILKYQNKKNGLRYLEHFDPLEYEIDDHLFDRARVRGIDIPEVLENVKKHCFPIYYDDNTIFIYLNYRNRLVKIYFDQNLSRLVTIVKLFPLIGSAIPVSKAED